MVTMTNSDSDSLLSRLVRSRVWIQTAFLALWLDPLKLRLHSVCSPVFHCYSCPLAAFACPIGVLANFSALHVFPFIALGTLIVIGGLVGSFVCGWACPFGFLQDLAARLPLPKIEIPSWSGTIRYAVLAVLVLAVPFLFGESHPLFFCSLCPAGALEGALPNAVRSAASGQGAAWPSAIKLTILGVVIVGMFLAYRPWCAILCPLGAIHGLFNRVSLLYLKIDPDTCNRCQECRKMCHYGVQPERNTNDSRCIRCLACSKCAAISVARAGSGAAHPLPHARHEVQHDRRDTIEG